MYHIVSLPPSPPTPSLPTIPQPAAGRAGSRQVKGSGVQGLREPAVSAVLFRSVGVSLELGALAHPPLSGVSGNHFRGSIGVRSGRRRRGPRTTKPAAAVIESSQLTSRVSGPGSFSPKSAGPRFKSAPPLSSGVMAPITPPSRLGVAPVSSQ